MDFNKALSAFILDDVLPLEKDPFSRAVLGGLAAAAGTSFFDFNSLQGLDVNTNPEELHGIIKGVFAAQPTITLSMADFISQEKFEKYPILKIERLRQALERPYDIDLETVEKFIALLAKE